MLSCSLGVLRLPEFALLESSRLERGDDAEVVRTTFEG